MRGLTEYFQQHVAIQPREQRRRVAVRRVAEIPMAQPFFERAFWQMG